VKIRILIIVLGAIVTAGTIHFFQERQQTGRQGRFRDRFEDFGPRGQNPPSQGRGARSGPGRRQVLEVRSLFDQDGDQKLDVNERARARKHATEERANGSAFPRQSTSNSNSPLPGPKISPDQVPPELEASLYDEGTLRTLFIEFTTDDWESELADFWKTDVDVPSSLWVDQKEIGGIGVRFRGTSSFFTVGTGLKRSLNLAIDYGDKEQRLYGYKTLNLLNAHTDPSFVRTVLFNHIARNYIPAPKANFLQLVINGESWGVYVNSQQFNKDFLNDWFGTTKGVRWKMPPNPRGGNGMGFQGDSPAGYDGRYVMKSSGGDADWAQLIRVFKALNETAPSILEETLNPIFNIDRALWFLALENVFIDNDGYWTRASDFSMYSSPEGRLHMIPHDSNETFRKPGGPGYTGDSGVNLDPLYGIDDDTKPLIHRLLKVPHLKARYMAHVRTLRDEWLDWDRIEPLVTQYQNLIDNVIKTDTRKHDSYEAFRRSALEDQTGMGSRGPEHRISLKGFVQQRRDYLDNYGALKLTPPIISKVHHSGFNDTNVAPQQPTYIHAAVEHPSTKGTVFLYFSDKKESAFQRVPMKLNGTGEYIGAIPPREAGEKIYYYVEARSQQGDSSSFFPRTAEFNALSYRVHPQKAVESPILFNEIMASNTTTVADPDGEFDDWIELRNRSENPVDLSGFYLSDNPRNPRKWEFPNGTAIPEKGLLIVWADEDSKSSTEGLHANFKLSKKGETIGLYDRNDKGNQQLDEVIYKALEDDQSWGRQSAAATTFKVLNPSPGNENE
jgi:hypothetical protein